MDYFPNVRCAFLIISFHSAAEEVALRDNSLCLARYPVAHSFYSFIEMNHQIIMTHVAINQQPAMQTIGGISVQGTISDNHRQ